MGTEGGHFDKLTSASSAQAMTTRRNAHIGMLRCSGPPTGVAAGNALFRVIQSN